MTDLNQRHCEPCRGGVPKLAGDKLRRYAEQLPDWQVVDEHHLEREFSFPDFVTALAFVNRIGALAEEEAHHPDILLAWGRVQVKVWTHTIDGLSANDLIYAAKCDRLV